MKALKVILYIVAANVALVPAMLAVNWLVAESDAATMPTAPAIRSSGADPVGSGNPELPAAQIDDSPAPLSPNRFDKIEYQLEIAELADALNAMADSSVISPEYDHRSGSASAGCAANFRSSYSGKNWRQQLRVSANFADVTRATSKDSDGGGAQVKIDFTPTESGGNRVEEDVDGFWRPHPANFIILLFPSRNRAKQVEAMIIDLRDRCRRLRLHEREVS